MLEAEDVRAVLYEFSLNTLRKHTGESGIPLDTGCAERLFSSFLVRGNMTAMDIKGMADIEARALSEILTQYIMFLSMFTDLTFPDWFLQGSNRTALGAPVLRYMAEHRWPFPELSPHGRSGAAPGLH